MYIRVRQAYVYRRALPGRKDGLFMNKMTKIFTIIGCITAIVASIVAAAAVLNYFDKKKQDAELEAYLEGAIQ